MLVPRDFVDTGSARLFFIAVLLSCTAAQAQEPPPLEAYGALPMVGSISLSPSGNRTVSRMNFEGNDLIMVLDLLSGDYITAADAALVDPRRLVFPQEDKVIMIVSSGMLTWYADDPFAYSVAHVMDVATAETRLLLEKAQGLVPHQTGLGRIRGHSPDAQTLYMPALVARLRSEMIPHNYATYGLYSVRLDKTRERLIARGNRHTINWFVDGAGKPLIREDFNDPGNRHQIWRIDGKKDQLLYEQRTEIPTLKPVGLTPQYDALVALGDSAGTRARLLYLISLSDGEVTGRPFERDGLTIASVISDINRVVYGVEYAGFLPTYSFFDNALSKRMTAIQKLLPGASVSLSSWNSDFSKLIVRVSGGWHSGSYLLFESGKTRGALMAQERPLITDDHVANTSIDEYEARDGLMIPALVTAKKEVAEEGNASLIVLPHGGPESHDRFGFDWLAQYFASRGYVVLQPQFRGSTGFGSEFILAGRGEWGRKMQSDLDDGVHYLVNKGMVNPDRVCIVGASYGGYAALAGGAFSPDLYRCIVAIAPVSDLRKMLKQSESSLGRKNRSVNYWESQFGAEASDKAVLRAISPVHHADAFTAPVLILHGKEDGVVPPEQSKLMYKALLKSNKDVTFVELEGQDHWLSQADTRLETLRLIAAFIDEHL